MLELVSLNESPGRDPPRRGRDFFAVPPSALFFRGLFFHQLAEMRQSFHHDPSQMGHVCPICCNHVTCRRTTLFNKRRARAVSPAMTNSGRTLIGTRVRSRSRVDDLELALTDAAAASASRLILSTAAVRLISAASCSTICLFVFIALPRL